jgi:hypothetical protein
LLRTTKGCGERNEGIPPATGGILGSRKMADVQGCRSQR